MFPLIRLYGNHTGMALYLPSFIPINEGRKQGPKIRTGADCQQDHREQALKVEYRTLKEVVICSLKR